MQRIAIFIEPFVHTLVKGPLWVFSRMDDVASEGVDPMLRKTMIVLATAAALTGGLTADAFARGGGGGGGHGGGARMGGFGGGHVGGGLGGGHMGGARMGGGFGGGHMAGAHMGRGFGGARVGGGFSRGQFASPGRAFAR